jgi:hypothetical protein
MGNKKPSSGTDPAIALLSSSWKSPEYPRDAASINGLFSHLQNRDIEKLFQVMKVLATKADEEVGALGTKTQQGEVNQYPYGLWFNLPLHAFPESISKEDAKYALGMLHEYFGVLKSLTYYGDYEFSVKFNLEALDFLFLKGLVDEKYTRIGVANDKIGIQFKFKDLTDSMSATLTIGDLSLMFDKTPAAIIRFFYQSRKISGDYKNAKDFQVFYAENESVMTINSNEFRKKVDSINKRVYVKTNGLIKELIEMKTKERKNEINEYRLSKAPG